MVILFLFRHHWFICACRMQNFRTVASESPNCCYLCVGLHSHRLRSCSETLQGWAVIVRQEGRRVVKRSGPTVWRRVVWFALLRWRQITDRCDGQPQRDSDCGEQKVLKNLSLETKGYLSQSQIWSERCVRAVISRLWCLFVVVLCCACCYFLSSSFCFLFFVVVVCVSDEGRPRSF